MSTPTSVLYSPHERGPHEFLPALEPELERLGLAVLAVGKIGLDEEDEMSFLGGEVECTTLTQALDVATDWGDFALRMLAEEPRGYLYLYWWSAGGLWNFNIELDSALVFFENGAWLRPALITVMSKLRADACAFGPRYEPGLFHPLDAKALAEDLRTGRLLETRFPHFHMLSTRLVSAEDVEAAMARPHPPRLKYELVTSGYHVLYSL
jgi:hypothetical protein